MGEPRLLPYQLPGWPRLMGVDLAAAYVGMSPSGFQDAVTAKVLPSPTRIGRRVLWDRAMLDRAVDERTGATTAREDIPTTDPLLETLHAKAQGLRDRHQRRPKDAR